MGAHAKLSPHQQRVWSHSKPCAARSMATFDVKLENHAPKSTNTQTKTKTQKQSPHCRDRRRRAVRRPYPSPMRYMLPLTPKMYIVIRADMRTRTAASQAGARRAHLAHASDDRRNLGETVRYRASSLGCTLPAEATSSGKSGRAIR